MLLKSLLFAMLLSAAAAGKPRLRGTSSDVNEGASPDIIERAAVSNQISRFPEPRPPTGSVTSRTLVVFPPRLEG